MTHFVLALCQAAALASAAPAAAASTQQPVPQETVATEGHEASLRRARDLATSGEPALRELAVALYSSMLERSPDNSDVLLGRGRTYAWMGRYAEAEADLLAATRLAPGYADTWSALGDMYLWSDRPQQAVEAYTHWVDMKPDDAAAVIARGRAHRATGNIDAARADFAAAGVRGGDVAVDQLVPSSMVRVSNPEAVVAAGYQWSLRLEAAHSAFSGNRADWNDYEVALRRKFDRGSLAIEWLQAHRFGGQDDAWALDGYASLWPRAYVNARFQQSPRHGLLPRESWRVELFQGFGQGWEWSASYDHLQFSSGTDIYGVGVGRYVGNFYMRYKAQHVPGAGSGSLSHRGLVRYYYAGNADDYFEVRGGNGRSDDLDRFGRIVSDNSSSIGVAFVKFFHPQWGIRLGAGYSDGSDGFDEARVNAALYTRW